MCSGIGRRKTVGEECAAARAIVYGCTYYVYPEKYLILIVVFLTIIVQ